MDGERCAASGVSVVDAEYTVHAAQVSLTRVKVFDQTGRTVDSLTISGMSAPISRNTKGTLVEFISFSAIDTTGEPESSRTWFATTGANFNGGECAFTISLEPRYVLLTATNGGSVRFTKAGEEEGSKALKPLSKL